MGAGTSYAVPVQSTVFGIVPLGVIPSSYFESLIDLERSASQGVEQSIVGTPDGQSNQQKVLKKSVSKWQYAANLKIPSPAVKSPQVSRAALPSISAQDFYGAEPSINTGLKNDIGLKPATEPQTKAAPNLVKPKLAKFSKINSVAAVSLTSKTDGYVDQLIDPSKAEDSFSDFVDRSDARAMNLAHTLEFGVDYQDFSGAEQSTTDFGFSYNAYTPTNNYGDLYLRLISEARDNFDDGRFLFSDGEDDDQSLQWASIQQIGLPLSAKLSADNVIGTHRLPSPRAVATGGDLIGRRLDIANTRILGVSSSIYSNQSGNRLTLSAGRVGRNLGAVFDGFVETENDLALARYTHNLKGQVLNFDLWQFDSGELDGDDVVGGSVSWRAQLGSRYSVLASLNTSDGNQALIGGLGYRGDSLEHEIGVYDFDPDYQLLDRRTNSGARGVYYSLRSKRGYGWHYSGSAEYQEMQSNGDANNQSISLRANTGYRIDFDRSVNFGYLYRSSDRGQNRSSIRTIDRHSLSMGLSHRLFSNWSAAAGLQMQRTSGDDQSDDEDSFRFSYSFGRDFADGDNLQLRLEHDYEDRFEEERNLTSLILDWSRSYGSSLTFNAGLGVTYEDAGARDNTNYSGSLGFNWLINERLSLDAQANFNHNDFTVEERVLGLDDFITDGNIDEFSDLEFSSDNTYASLRLRYDFGQTRSESVLGRRANGNGSGMVYGRVFEDDNKDGRWQSTEKPVAGVTLFLDGIYPVVSDQNGEFKWSRVGVGQHGILLDEKLLPLPWMTKAEIFPVFVRLRSRQEINIPVEQLADELTLE